MSALMDIKKIELAQTAFYQKGHTRSFSFRKKQLEILLKAIKTHESEIITALERDFGKSSFESYMTEIGITYTDIKHHLAHLKKWMREDHYSTSFALFPSSSKVVHEPRGKCFIIAPWNYPFQLVLTPLIAAIAGGNTVLLKPSELTPNTANVIEKLISQHFSPEYIAVVQGEGASVSERVFKEYKPDFLFFTGSPTVGAIIAQRAAVDLIPYVLELGGKSPVIVDETANIKIAARRILWGKVINAGQTCIAPDYLLVHASIKDVLVNEMIKTLKSWYPEGALKSSDYPNIINEKRFEVLKGYLDQGKTIYGGQFDTQKRRLEPTLIWSEADTPGLMTEEIFGPILPIISYQNTDEAIEIIGKNPNPLALYIFTSSAKQRTLFTRSIAFGGGCINNTLVHIGNAHLPFGGVRSSGIGSYHGHAGFTAFTHAKSIVRTGNWLDIAAKYPPYASWKDKLIRFLLK